MKEVIARTEEYKGRKFELSLNFDEKALVDGDFRITARVKTWPVDNPKAVQLAEAEVSIEPDKEGRPILRVTLRGNAAGWEGKKDVFEKPLWDLIDAEQVLDWIPAWCFTGDPITGCLVRAGLSALIGQTLDCKKSTAELPWFKPRMKALGQCMVHHIPDMGVTAAARAARCVMRFGF